MTTSTETRDLAVVTGTSTGIGRATALRLAADGFHVLAGVRTPTDAESISTEHVEGVLLDVTDNAHIADLAARIATDPSGRRLRVLVNNAGIAINAPVEVLTLADWRRQFEVSFFGQVALTRALLPMLLATGGRILNVTSVGGRIAMADYGAYSAAKFAMEAMSDSLRREVRDLGVEVIKITPGAVSTNLTASGLAESERVATTMSAEQHRRYDDLVAAFTAQAEAFARGGATPERAAEVISRALSARRPKTRYTVGRDGAMFTAMSRIASDRFLDRVLRAQNQRLTRSAAAARP